ncbi:phage tail tape measure protein [Embleya sp. NPDC059237]|uniref:phage tail tape measure protein n=1 Tax=Embleya sp. NPDC059237 TaxID=3346784 RepID=UPI0036C33DF5
MALNVGELVGFASLDTRDLDRGAGHVTAVMQGLAGDVTRTSEQAGTGAGQGLIGRLIDQIRAGAASAVQGLANVLTPGSTQAGNQAGDASAAALQAQLDAGARQAGASAGTALDRSLGSAATSAGTDAGQDAGAALGDALAEEAADAGGEAGEKAGMSLKQKLIAGAALAATAAGAALVAGLKSAMDQEQASDLLAAQLGASPEMAKEFGGIAGHLFSRAYGESISEVNDALRGVWQQGLIDEDAATADIEAVAAKAMDLSTILQEDVGKVTATVGQMIKTGMAKDASEAFDVLVRGAQQGVNKSEDLLDTFNEYPTQFRKLGLDATTAMGLLSQGLKNGARDSDLVADALKEFSIRAVDGSKSSAEAFKALGLDAEEMTAKIARGGPEASAGLQTVLDRLRAMKDPVEQNAAAVGLFGTQSEDLGKALYALDPSKAVAALGDVAGAADKAGKTMHDNAATKVEAFKRKVTQAFVETLGDKVLPRAEEFARSMKDRFGPSVRDAGRWVRDDLVPVLRDVAGWLDDHVVPAAVATGRVLRDDVVPAVKDTATWIGNNKEPILAVAAAITLFLLPSMVAAGVGATVSAATQVTAWVLTRTTATTSAITSAAAHWTTIAGWVAAGAAATWNAAIVVAGWVTMGTQALIRGAQMAAAWILAMGPIAWVTVAIIAIAALVIYYWDEIVSGTRAAWSWVTGLVSGAWQSIKDGAASAGRWVSDKVSALSSAVVGFFASMKDGAEEKGRALMDWVRGIPGSIRDGLGDVGRLLWDAGTKVIQGLIDGISSKISSVKGVLSSITDMIPFSKGPPVKDAKLLTPNGKLIMQGLLDGIDSQTPALRAQLAGLTASMPSLAALPRITSVGGTTPVAADRTGPMVQINGGWHSAGESPDQLAAALDWQMRGRG